MSRLIDLTGKRFGRWTVIARHSNNSKNLIMWHCKCDCGRESNIPGGNLRYGLSRSCGCLAVETCRKNFTTHGMSHKAPEHLVWLAMMQRCFDAKSKDYKRYMERGITICEHWRDFANFYADMGPRPTPQHSIDRIDNDGNYEPGNCRWATRTQQLNNTSRNRYVVYRGERMTFMQAVNKAGVVKRTTARQRIDTMGWSLEDALETPPNTQKRGRA